MKTTAAIFPSHPREARQENQTVLNGFGFGFGSGTSAGSFSSGIQAPCPPIPTPIALLMSCTQVPQPPSMKEVLNAHPMSASRPSTPSVSRRTTGFPRTLHLSSSSTGMTELRHCLHSTGKGSTAVLNPKFPPYSFTLWMSTTGLGVPRSRVGKTGWATPSKMNKQGSGNCS